jgi:hypothetical protein
VLTIVLEHIRSLSPEKSGCWKEAKYKQTSYLIPYKILYHDTSINAKKQQKQFKCILPMSNFFETMTSHQNKMKLWKAIKNKMKLWKAIKNKMKLWKTIKNKMILRYMYIDKSISEAYGHLIYG